MFLFKKTIKVATHNGKFHPDEVLACAVLSLWAEKNNSKLKITRTRDQKFIDEAEIVVDVGMVYDGDKKRFDHHQKGGAGVRENGLPYASFGLVWKHYGEAVSGSKELADLVEKKLVLPIDAKDNGVNISKTTDLGVLEYGLGDALSSFNTTWLEDSVSNEQQFFKALEFAKEVIKRELAEVGASLEGYRLTKDLILKQNTPEILILESYFDWGRAVSEFKNIKIVVYPNKNGENWHAQVGRDDLEDYDSDRVKFPVEWRGLRDGELAQVSGIPDAVFCTSSGWLAVARTRAAALQMAKLTLSNQ